MPALSYTQDFFGESVTTDSNELVAPVPSAFATYQVDDEYVIGVGFYLPWGLSSSWPEGPQTRCSARAGIPYTNHRTGHRDGLE